MSLSWRIIPKFQHSKYSKNNLRTNVHDKFDIPQIKISLSYPHIVSLTLFCTNSIFTNEVFLKYRRKNKQAQRRAVEGRFRHKRYVGNLEPGAVLSHTMPKRIFIILIVLVGKKHTKLVYICHGYINYHQSIFISPI